MTSIRFARVAGLAAALLLAGCGGNLLAPTGAAPTLYTLRAPSGKPPSTQSVKWQLLVEIPDAALNLDSVRIAVTPSANRMDYFAGAAWADRPPSMLQDLLLEGFDQSGRIGAVERRSGGLRADFILVTEIQDFEAEAGPDQSRAHIRITARLVRSRDKSIVAVHTFESAAPVGIGIDSVVEGFNQAVGEVLPQIVDWTLDQGDRNP